MATARDATPEDFDKKAQEYANNFWLWAELELGKKPKNY